MVGTHAIKFLLGGRTQTPLAMSMARLWRDQSKPQQARELLAPYRFARRESPDPVSGPIQIVVDYITPISVVLVQGNHALVRHGPFFRLGNLGATKQII